jgi:diamine N-acetyltransferase
MAVGLRDVTAETVRAICRLEVHDEQRAFVAPVAVSIAQAHFEPSAVMRAVYAGDQPVGFMLWRDGGQPKTAFLWRFMIDKAHQKKGFGRVAMQLAFAELRSQGLGQFKTSVVLGTHGPLDFYLSLGFAETNETTGNGERILQKVL